MKKTYVLSSEFDYALTIFDDCGPGYAKDMSWDYTFLADIHSYQDYINIIDQRMTAPECLHLENYIGNHKNTIFLLKVVDPYHDLCRKHWYYQFLFRVKNLSNVFFLTVYRPAEIVAELDHSTGSKKLVVIPYAFVHRNRISNTPERRINKIIFQDIKTNGCIPSVNSLPEP